MLYNSENLISYNFGFVIKKRKKKEDGKVDKYMHESYETSFPFFAI